MAVTTFMFACPIDGLAFLVVSPSMKGDIERDSEPRGHLHLEASDEMTCLNGHVWRVPEDVILERVR
jgi:hypothetical protein